MKYRFNLAITLAFKAGGAWARVVSRALAITLIVAVVTGCASMTGLSEAPRISLVSISPAGIRLLEQRFLVSLRIQNPNDRDITIRGLDYEIVVNDKVFARGVSGKPVSVAAWSDTTAEVEVVTSLDRIMEQLRGLATRGKPTIDYAISGHVSVDGIPFPVPFEYQDSLALPEVEERDKKRDDEPVRQPKAISI